MNQDEKNEKFLSKDELERFENDLKEKVAKKEAEEERLRQEASDNVFTTLSAEEPPLSDDPDIYYGESQMLPIVKPRHILFDKILRTIFGKK